MPTRAACLSLSFALLCGCASARAASVRPLCGVWQEQAPGMSERWRLDERGLQGEGGQLDASGVWVPSERLWLRAERGGHVYVAQPSDVAPTEFRPIAPDEARFPVAPPAAATVWVWANYEHDFPQEIHYAMVGDRLDIVIAGPNADGGRSMGWTLERVASCDEATGDPS